MARIILLTDFSEEYAKLLLKGIAKYSKEHEPWVICKMPLSYRDVNGIEGVVKWALGWKADVIIGQFYPTDNVKLFPENGIIAVAQDFITRFRDIPNITGAHHLAGKIGARYFIQKGFKYFAFYGFKDIVWSQERSDGFMEELKNRGFEDCYFEYQNEDLDDLWYYQSEPLKNWLKTLPKPIAIMACDDSRAIHITQLCRQLNIRIPAEVAVLGVDNDESVCTLFDPPLSSLNQAVEKGGYEAAQLIDKMLNDPTLPIQDIVVYPTNVVTRESTDIYATEDKYISNALQIIHQHSDGRISVNEIVDRLPLSRRLLEIRFKEVTGLSIYNYILNLRIDKFAQRLLESKLPIIEIVMDMGFFDYKNISRQFKQIKGCTPSEYRFNYALR
jgi:LacI family transcriptional regulator